jgi:hypothetical protein
MRNNGGPQRLYAAARCAPASAAGPAGKVSLSEAVRWDGDGKLNDEEGRRPVGLARERKRRRREGERGQREGQGFKEAARKPASRRHR